jgi:2-polyprenylphenol hydroxylase and related flavodoxin oxidoreductases
MKKTVIDFLLIENKQLNKDNFRLTLQSPLPLSDVSPGQFTNVEIEEAKEIFLRRPFSILDVDYEKQTISLLIKILGRGSKKITEAKPDQVISAIFPLGKSFSQPQKSDKVLLIGGGSGVAPMLFLAKTCGLNPSQIHVLIGAKSSADHIDITNYKQFGQFYYTTEDGSLGEKGYVTNHSLFNEQIDQFDKIYTCGPDPMMKAVARVAKEKNIFCEVSLENMMACGFGVCLCCVEDTKTGHKCVCTDGPVFNINDLKW